MRYHFVREYVEEGIIKIKFVSNDKNLADMFTKNATKKMYDLHAPEMVSIALMKHEWDELILWTGRVLECCVNRISFEDEQGRTGTNGDKLQLAIISFEKLWLRERKWYWGILSDERLFYIYFYKG